MTRKTPPEVLRQLLALQCPRVDDLSATGSSMTVRVSAIVKVVEEGEGELELLEAFGRVLGADAASVFPRFHLLGSLDGWRAVELEDLGSSSLEDMMLDVDVPTQDVQRVVEGVVGHIRRLASVRPESGPVDGYARGFIGELLDAIARNAGAAQLPAPALSFDDFFERTTFTPTLCHRDLSTGNVMCPSDGPRLIDARWTLPGSQRRRPSEPFGSVAVDCAALAVSLWRKDQERERVDGVSVGWSEAFTGSAVEVLISEGVFDQHLYDLCLLHAYSVYAACRCDYCLASERRWLYEAMRRRFQEVSSRITN